MLEARSTRIVSGRIRADWMAAIHAGMTDAPDGQNPIQHPQ
jgi:hypothetical protein